MSKPPRYRSYEAKPIIDKEEPAPSKPVIAPAGPGKYGQQLLGLSITLDSLKRAGHADNSPGVLKLRRLFEEFKSKS
jgi:hypothetical protein